MISEPVGKDYEQIFCQLLTNRALAQFNLKHYQQTVDDCNKVLKVDGTNLKAIYRRGMAKMELGQLDDAINDMKQVEAKDKANKVVKSKINEINKKIQEQ